MSENKLATESTEICGREIEHNSIVKNAAAEGIVLLKNNGVLPLENNVKNIALFGAGARQTIKGGTGSGDVNVRSFVNIEKGLENCGYHIVTKPYLEKYETVISTAKQDYVNKLQKAGEQGLKTALFTMFSYPFKEPEIEPVKYEDTKKYKADTAIYVIARNSGEGADRKAVRGDYYLSESELNDIKILSENYERFVLLLNVGGVIDISEIITNENINAVLLISQGGSSFGDAVGEIICGKITPSGKLSTTWAKAFTDYPFADEFSDEKYISDTYYREGIFVGYRWFEKNKTIPLFPFGFGLSYTTFEIFKTILSVQNDVISIKAEVKNIGFKFSGKEVVQIYVGQPKGTLEKAVKSLVSFRKTKLLDPQESELIELKFSIRDLASFYEENSSYILDKGEYTIFIGNSSASVKPISKLVLSESVITEKCKTTGNNNITEYTDFLKEELESTDIEKIYIDAKSISSVTHTYETLTIAGECTDFRYTYDDYKNGNISLKEFVCDLKPEELTSLCTGASRVGLSDLSFIGNASKSIPGAAGDTCNDLSQTRKIPSLLTADGPAGIRVNMKVYEKDGLYIDNPADDPIKSILLPKNIQKVNLEGTQIKYQFCTAIPIATMLAQTWNMDLIEKCGKLVAKEAELLGIDLWLAPALNIQRNPLCGRNFEYYSEDPVLSGECASAIVKGFQCNCKSGVVIKHFACNNKENNRNYNNSVLSERALREIYLKGFEICVKKASPVSVMSSYNLINGIHAANNKALLSDILRDEWGFKGIVMTDWYATQGNSSVPGGYCSTDTAQCIIAGNDLIMPGSKGDIDKMIESLKKCFLTLPELRLSAERILKVIERCEK